MSLNEHRKMGGFNMHVTAALPVAQKDRQSEIGERSQSELAGLAKAQTAHAANSTRPCAPLKVEDDVEDMWDNMPI